MKTLRPGLWLISLFALLTSCTSYQYATLDSTLPQPSSDGFTFENDTIEVQYSFAGANCPLMLSIFNKLDSPIFIDWNQSAVIINGNSFALNPGKSDISTNYTESTINFSKTYEYTDGSMDGTITHADRSGFIPPKSHLNVNELSIISEFLPTTGATKTRKHLQDNTNQPYEVNAFSFTKEQSPLEFRCFLTYADKNRKQWHSIDHEFWVSSLYKMTGVTLMNRPDRYFVSRASGAGTAIGIVAITGLVVVGLKYGETEEPDTF